MEMVLASILMLSHEDSVSIVIAGFGVLGPTMADWLDLTFRRITINDNLTIPLYAGFLMSLGAFWEPNFADYDTK